MRVNHLRFRVMTHDSSYNHTAWKIVESIDLFCLLHYQCLTYSFFNLHLLYQPCEELCQATCVQTHQGQPRSTVAIATCEVHVWAVDSHTIPIVATGVLKPLCCQQTLTSTLTSENLYIPLYSFPGRYKTMHHTLLTS